MDSSIIFHVPSGRRLKKKELYRMIKRRVLNYLKEFDLNKFVVLNDNDAFDFFIKIIEEEGYNYEIVKREMDLINFIKNSKGVVFTYPLEDSLNIFFHFLLFEDYCLLKGNYFPLSIVSLTELKPFLDYRRVFNKYDEYIRRLTIGGGNLNFSFSRGFNSLLRMC